jgi:hypothetical protein
MYSNMNFPAPLAVMGFLAAGGGLVLALIAIAVASFIGRPKVARIVLRLTAIAVVTYFALLVGFSLASHERVLQKGEEKYFCEIDCHIAYSVQDVKINLNPNTPLHQYSITVHTRFDEKTISPTRGNGPLTPNPRMARLVDSAGHEYSPTDSEELSFLSELRPGESYNVQLTFAVPATAQDLKLIVASTDWPQSVLIGDENSWLHRRTYFAVPN